ncbi:hypothetical protein FJY68_05100 [candidate division WOR-3 bacterium]|uniref:GWxTD domain-containing protein n=1 Tax=candidate division WOR-3 bacterium TaxID=2052148 RepID=A0A937XFP4_UNCW3|nr:hypothetical protein [candidate division WOR-3 bacterium]
MTTQRTRNLQSAACILHLAVLLLFLSSCSQVRQVSPADALTDEERLNYLVLAALASDAAQQYASAGSAMSRADYLDWFWKNPPISVLTSPSPLLPSPSIFYRQRALQARMYFGATDLLNDDRVRTYIRHGPARREQYETRFIDTETSRIFVNPAEIWSYDSLGRQYDFVRTGTAFKIVGESRYGPRAMMPALEPAVFARSAPEFASATRPLGLEVSLGRLSQHGDSVEVELAFGIPLRTILAEFQPQSQPLINVAIDLVPRAKGTPAHSSSWLSCSMPPDTTAVDFAVGREVFNLPADIYTFSVTAVTADGQAASKKVQDLNLIDYARRNQPVSDVLFYSLVDSTSQSSQFNRLDWTRVVPLVASRVRSGQSFYVLYEIYHLGQDSTGNHNAQVNYELVQRETREKAVLPAPQRYITGIGSTGVAVERVHTMDLKPGPYLLISRVTDMLASPDDSHTASATAEFEILPRR